jgi:hypothetical protein
MSILAAPYVFAGTVSLFLGYKTYNSYYNQQFEYLEIEDLQNENKEKPQEEEDIIKEDIIKEDIIKEEDNEILIPFPELTLSPSPPSPLPPPSPTLSPSPPSPSIQKTKRLPNIFVEDKLEKNNKINKLHNPVIVMETILEGKPENSNTLRRRKKKNRNRKN